MEVSKLQGQMPLFVKPQIKDEKTAFVQKQSSKPDNAKQLYCLLPRWQLLERLLL